MMRLESRRRTGRAKASLRLLAAVVGIGPFFVAAPGMAQDSGFHPIDSALEMLDMKTKAGTMPDFVKQARPAEEGDFLPVGTKHRVRAEKIKTPAEVKAAEAELDAARDAQQAGKRPKPSASVAAKPDKNKPDKKKPMKITPAIATNR